MIDQTTRSVFYWPDIYSDAGRTPYTIIASSDESLFNSSTVDGKITPYMQPWLGKGRLMMVYWKSLENLGHLKGMEKLMSFCGQAK